MVVAGVDEVGFTEEEGTGVVDLGSKFSCGGSGGGEVPAVRGDSDDAGGATRGAEEACDEARPAATAE